MFEITVVEITDQAHGVANADRQQRYTQTVETLDMKALIAAVNNVPRKPRTRKEKE